MGVVLDHVVVRSTDRRASARFFARLLGLRVEPPAGPFAPVRVDDGPTLDFDDRGPVLPGHYGFLVDDDTFDALLEVLAEDPGIRYGSGPGNGWDRRINTLAGGRGVYVGDPDGHSYEFFTARPA
ncbi:VOC family protein [Saccharothrix longispora]|uniref:VOC family protein n=1 Tax=Saccharothrix longispora TaxID=33920 RepID=UPI0028FD8E80|nr:VOC family protein [Saccharothrix longispora]MDU0287602.1 VOC family protein [Saccharothrix longispora]